MCLSGNNAFCVPSTVDFSLNFASGKKIDSRGPQNLLVFPLGAVKKG